MAKYKIIHDRENCIGCGSCIALCPESWKEGSDGKSDLIKGKKNEQEINDLACNMDAAKACPVNVIHIFEGKKKLI